MIANLIFDLSGYGGSANFTAATEAILINELNTLTGVAWYWDPADCKPKSNFYPVVPPVITTKYKVSFVDIDGDSTGFCNAGSLDFTKFNEIDLTAYGGSATTAIANNTDIVNAFAALTPSLTVSISGCSVIIDNWNRNSTPTNVEVNKIAGCIVNTQSYGGIIISRESAYELPTAALNPYEIYYIINMLGNIGTPDIVTDFGDGSPPISTPFPYNSFIHTFPTTDASYTIVSTYVDDNGNTTALSMEVNVVNSGEVRFQTTAGEASPYKIVLNSIDTPITFDTSDCNNILWSLSLSVNYYLSQPTVGTQEIEVIFGGNTTSIATGAGGSGLADFINIPGTFNIPGSNVLIVNYKTNGVVTASFNVTVVIN